jgi:hypothetical protein
VRLPESVLNPETILRIGPLDVVELVADDAACPALDTPLVGEQHRPIRLGRIASSRTAIDALLPFTLQADQTIDDTNMRAVWIDNVRVDTELFLKTRAVKDTVNNHEMTRFPDANASRNNDMLPSDLSVLLRAPRTPSPALSRYLCRNDGTPAFAAYQTSG